MMPQGHPTHCGCERPDAFEVARHSKRLVEQLREQLSAVTADLERVESHRDSLANMSYRVISERDQLRAEVEALRKDAVRWRYVRLQGDDTHWLNLLRVDLDEFGGNINAAVDALIDGEAPAMSAKEA